MWALDQTWPSKRQGTLVLLCFRFHVERSDSLLTTFLTKLCSVDVFLWSYYVAEKSMFANVLLSHTCLPCTRRTVFDLRSLCDCARRCMGALLLATSASKSLPSNEKRIIYLCEWISCTTFFMSFSVNCAFVGHWLLHISASTVRLRTRIYWHKLEISRTGTYITRHL